MTIAIAVMVVMMAVTMMLMLLGHSAVGGVMGVHGCAQGERARPLARPLARPPAPPHTDKHTASCYCRVCARARWRACPKHVNMVTWQRQDFAYAPNCVPGSFNNGKTCEAEKYVQVTDQPRNANPCPHLTTTTTTAAASVASATTRAVKPAATATASAPVATGSRNTTRSSNTGKGSGSLFEAGCGVSCVALVAGVLLTAACVLVGGVSRVRNGRRTARCGTVLRDRCSAASDTLLPFGVCRQPACPLARPPLRRCAARQRVVLCRRVAGCSNVTACARTTLHATHQCKCRCARRAKTRLGSSTGATRALISAPPFVTRCHWTMATNPAGLLPVALRCQERGRGWLGVCVCARVCVRGGVRGGGREKEKEKEKGREKGREERERERERATKGVGWGGVVQHVCVYTSKGDQITNGIQKTLTSVPCTALIRLQVRLVATHPALGRPK